MIERLLNLSKNNSLLLFGARGTGKSTLLNHLYHAEGKTLWIDLLSEEDEERFCRHPQELSKALELREYQIVIIDEVQKAPKLLDIVHQEIEKNKNIQFILTGSSARKLKRGGANLLAGRAFTYNLFPMTHLELQDQFDLESALNFGTLPKLINYTNNEDKIDFLRSYSQIYLKEEIQVEQLVRNLNPFRDFLEIAAQGNGEIINYSNIAKDIGVDHKTVANYFQILEDTLVGFFLPSFNRSIRKRQIEAPKFYLFDTGVKKALERTLTVPLRSKSYAYGKAFEHFIILEISRLNEYYKRDFKFSYLKTKDGAEIDLIVERPGMNDLLLEIKSTDKVSSEDVKLLNHFKKDWDREVEVMLLSQDQLDKKIDGVDAFFWKRGVEAIFNKVG